MERYLKKSSVQTAFIIVMCIQFLVFAFFLYYRNIGNQQRVVFLGGQDLLNDVRNTEKYAAGYNPYNYVEGEPHVPLAHANYPPLAYVGYSIMNQFCRNEPFSNFGIVVAMISTFFQFLLLYAACHLLIGASKLKSHLICLALFLSGVVMFSFERGNNIILAAALCMVFLLGYRSENRVLRECSFIALAIAAALKVYPAIFGLLLLFEKRWKEALRLVFYGLFTTFVPFLFLKGGFANIPALLENLKANSSTYQEMVYPRYGFRLISALALNVTPRLPQLEPVYRVIGAWMYRIFPVFDVLLSLLCILDAFFERKLWRKAMAFSLILINFPVNSGAYTALYLFAGILLFLSCDTLRKKELWYFAAFALILTPIQAQFPAYLQRNFHISLTDLMRNMVAYTLFVVTGVRGALAGIRFLQRKEPAGHDDATLAPACDPSI